ncbi:GNAT family N-acetyltransferase [Phreatobacter sp. AB_2022a]|uniref:GNAT family N-acetyltransferase n=1 Tax=Phreatobacter sp. AB_2022a TaxID=3003134 RepID=UPI00228707E0|nr:GNAT family N-acetyltransferase [Phreatobacter sp. AB_2022a]MCZ0733750.1 GNAT family N-acetyltransferase [Phreatobacter sp. AB_2022a]
MSDNVRNNAGEHRYELVVDGHVAAAHYTLQPGVITFVHTVVPEALGGRGVGSALARGALDDARAQGLKVVPQCPFIAGYIKKHPEYADLVA